MNADAVFKPVGVVYLGGIIDVRYRYQGERSERFVHALSEQELRDAVDSFAQFPALVEELTSGRAGIEYQIHPIERELTSVTQIGQCTNLHSERRNFHRQSVAKADS